MVRCVNALEANRFRLKLGENEMAKLCQIVAVVTGKKTRIVDQVTELYHRLQKAPLHEGLSRTYIPDEELGSSFRPKRKRSNTPLRIRLSKCGL